MRSEWEAWLKRCQSALIRRSAEPIENGDESAKVVRWLPDLFDPATRRFDRTGYDLVLGDGRK